MNHLFVVIVISMLTYLIPIAFPSYFIYKNAYIHSFIEVLSGILSILVGVFIIAHYKKFTKLLILSTLSASFIVLGVSELLHALVTNTFFFIWMRVLGNLLGGLLATVYLLLFLFKKNFLKTSTNFNSLAILLSLILLLILPVTLPNPLEAYVEDVNMIIGNINFSKLSILLNIIGGILYYSAALILIIIYVNIKEPVITSFISGFLIFGNSCFLFPGSTLWDFQWWYWHIIRLVAHFFIFLHAFKFYNSIIDDIIVQKTILADIQEKLITLHKYSVAEGLNALYSHDIKNRLSILKNYIEIFKNFYSSKDTLELVNAMEDEIDKVLRFLTEYNSALKMKSSQDNLYSIIMDIIKEFRIIAIEKSIHFDWNLSEDMKNLLVPRYIVEAALWNIIINSVEALNNTKEKNKLVKIYGTVSHNEAIIVIEDNGVGIPAHLKDKLFMPFQTSKSKGLGLGLSFVKFVAAILGSCVEIQSHESSGTRVIFKIPFNLTRTH